MSSLPGFYTKPFHWSRNGIIITPAMEIDKDDVQSQNLKNIRPKSTKKTFQNTTNVKGIQSLENSVLEVNTIIRFNGQA